MESSNPQFGRIQVEQILRMNDGEGERSYAKNSAIQKEVILRTKSTLEESISEVLNRPDDHNNTCIKIADMGCSTGPNALLPTLEMIHIIDHALMRRMNSKLPQALQVFLNDLPTNDFNAVFKSLQSFYQRLENENGGRRPLPCFIAAVPGSFYTRLFPPNSLHFVYSSWSLHWLSGVPPELVDEHGNPLNKHNIYIAKTSPPRVHKAYLAQFNRDFTAFLNSRSAEMISGGRLVLTLLGDTDAASGWDLFGMALRDMVSEGIVEESKLDYFNIPMYHPSAEEVRSIVKAQGSFEVHSLENIEVSTELDNDDDHGLVLDRYAKGKRKADHLRAVLESIVSSHFGDAVVDELFYRYSIKAADSIELGLKYSTILLSLCLM